MEKVAFISGGVFIYWSSIILTLAVVAAILLFLAVYIGKSKNFMGGFAAVPAALMLSIVLGRLIHWYCRADAYESLEAALGNFSAGGYALMGAFAGCILTAILLRLVQMVKNLPQMFDAMSIAGGAGIAVGRLASFFNSSDRGVAVPEHWGLPFAYPVTNAVSGVVENRLATFMLQSIFAGALVAVLLLYMLICFLRKKKIKDGDIALLFLSAYGGSQVILDSTHYDSLFMRSNGFISIVQILGVVALALVIIIFSVRMVRRHGLKFYHFLPWLGFAGAMGIACYMEYYVQRHGDQAAFAYTVMGAAIAAMIVLTVIVRSLWLMAPKAKKPRPRKIPAAPVPAAKVQKEDSWESQWEDLPEETADDSWLRENREQIDAWQEDLSPAEAEPELPAPVQAAAPSKEDDDWENDWKAPEENSEDDWLLQLKEFEFLSKNET